MSMSMNECWKFGTKGTKNHECCYDCLVFVVFKMEFDMNIQFNYELPKDKFLADCALDAVDNQMRLESIKTTLQRYQAHGIVPEVVLQEIIAQMRDFKGKKV